MRRDSRWESTRWQQALVRLVGLGNRVLHRAENPSLRATLHLIVWELCGFFKCGRLWTGSSFQSNAQMFTTAKSLPEPGHGPFPVPLCWWTCTYFYWRTVVPVWWEWKSGSFLYSESSPVECMHGRLWAVNTCALICLVINKTHLCWYLAGFSCSLSLLYGNW